VAEKTPAGKKPRVRKSAPTVRERVEAATAKEENVKPKRARKVVKFARKSLPVHKLRLRDRKVIKWLGRILRPIGWLLKHLIPRYFVNSFREVRQVQWPARRETWRLTLAVFIFAVVFGGMVAGVDKVLDEIFKKVVLK